MSIFEFREIFERYVGLTAAVQKAGEEPTLAEENLLQIGASEHDELSAICLHRRNRKRLFNHQTEARRDFLELLAKLSSFYPDREKLVVLAIECAKLVNDSEAQIALENLLNDKISGAEDIAVKNLEKELWSRETLPPPSAKQISYHLRKMPATVNLSGKD